MGGKDGTSGYTNYDTQANIGIADDGFHINEELSLSYSGIPCELCGSIDGHSEHSNSTNNFG